MPNHIHGIILIIDKDSTVGAIHELPLQNGRKQRREMLLPKIIGYFKMNTAKQINKLLNRSGQKFWQRNYYEHIIRNKYSLEQIQEYVHYNPLKWELDRENPNRKGVDKFDGWLYGKNRQ